MSIHPHPNLQGDPFNLCFCIILLFQMTSDDNDASEHRWRFSDLAEEPRRMLPPIQGYENKPLVSLEEAVEPLVARVPDVHQYALVAKRKCETPPGDETHNRRIGVDQIVHNGMEAKRAESLLYS